jgi:mono/diheme cytochrome c family protein
MEAVLYRVLFILSLPALALSMFMPAGPADAQSDEVQFTEEYLNDQEHIELGRELFRQQCTRCHGKGAYPGKAPDLDPDDMPPDEIYLKVTYGFGRMPAWENIFDDEQRKAITAYMKSDIFSN